MTFIKLEYNYQEHFYFIPTATDGTVTKLTEDHPSVKNMVAINPPHSLKGMEKYTGTIYALPTKYSPASRRPFDRTTDYWINV